MKKIISGIALIVMVALSSCSIFVSTKHHSAGGHVGYHPNVDLKKALNTETASIKQVSNNRNYIVH